MSCYGGGWVEHASAGDSITWTARSHRRPTALSSLASTEILGWDRGSRPSSQSATTSRRVQRAIDDHRRSGPERLRLRGGFRIIAGPEDRSAVRLDQLLPVRGIRRGRMCVSSRDAPACETFPSITVMALASVGREYHPLLSEARHVCRDRPRRERRRRARVFRVRVIVE